MARLPLVFSVAVLLISGCANYDAVARVNRTNQTYLEGLSTVLTSGPSTEKVKDIERNLASSREATVLALSQAGLAKIEAQAKFPDESSRRIYLNAELARIQTEFNENADAARRRATSLTALDGKLADAVKALYENGKDIQRYLELGFLERLFTNVRGTDPAKLQQIGEDLKSISQRLAPGVDGVVGGGGKP